MPSWSLQSLNQCLMGIQMFKYLEMHSEIFFIIVTIIIITLILVLVAKLLPVEMPCTNCRVLTKVLNGSNRRFLQLTPLTYKFN